MTIAQLHWQWIEKGVTVKTDLKAMRDIGSNDEMREFIKDTQGDWPLPEDALWLVVMERSQYFVQIYPTQDDSHKDITKHNMDALDSQANQ
jgi:hypothetical protein